MAETAQPDYTAIPPFAIGQQPATNEPTTDKATIQALLVEVRQLRLALERSTSLLPRMQLAANRVQGQQERIDRLSRELRDFRSQMAQHVAEKERAAATIKCLESEVGQETDPAHRKELESVAKQLAIELEQKKLQGEQERGQ